MHRIRRLTGKQFSRNRRTKRVQRFRVLNPHLLQSLSHTLGQIPKRTIKRFTSAIIQHITLALNILRLNKLLKLYRNRQNGITPTLNLPFSARAQFNSVSINIIPFQRQQFTTTHSGIAQKPPGTKQHQEPSSFGFLPALF